MCMLMTGVHHSGLNVSRECRSHFRPGGQETARQSLIAIDEECRDCDVQGCIYKANGMYVESYMLSKLSLGDRLLP